MYDEVGVSDLPIAITFMFCIYVLIREKMPDMLHAANFMQPWKKRKTDLKQVLHSSCLGITNIPEKANFGVKEVETGIQNRLDLHQRIDGQRLSQINGGKQ